MSGRKLTTGTKHPFWLICPTYRIWIQRFSQRLLLITEWSLWSPTVEKMFSYIIYFVCILNKNIHHSIMNIQKPLNHSKNKIWIRFDFLTNSVESTRKIRGGKCKLDVQISLMKAGEFSGKVLECNEGISGVENERKHKFKWERPRDGRW